MKKTIVGIFAHPDDEAYGPSGTIAQLAKENDVYIICVTKGDAGQDAEQNHEVTLAKRRANELRKSAKILGVKEVFFLEFGDGTLSNNMYHQVANKIQEKLEELQPKMLITYAPNGASGHLDHIAVSYITTYVFYRCDFITTMLQFCYKEEISNAIAKLGYFIYYPKGYTDNQIDKVVDISNVWEQKVTAMQTHASQQTDTHRLLNIYKQFPKEEHFLVVEKS